MPPADAPMPTIGGLVPMIGGLVCFPTAGGGSVFRATQQYSTVVLPPI